MQPNWIVVFKLHVVWQIPANYANLLNIERGYEFFVVVVEVWRIVTPCMSRCDSILGQPNRKKRVYIFICFNFLVPTISFCPYTFPHVPYRNANQNVCVWVCKGWMAGKPTGKTVYVFLCTKKHSHTRELVPFRIQYSRGIIFWLMKMFGLHLKIGYRGKCNRQFYHLLEIT